MWEKEVWLNTFFFPNRDPILVLLTNICSHIFLSKEREKYFFFRALGAEFFPFLLHMVYSLELPLICPFPPLHLARLKAKKGRERRRTFGTPSSSSSSSVRAKRGKNLLPPPPKKINRCSKGVGRGTRFANLFYARACFFFCNLVCRSIS